jgi:uncharacterized protein (TIGR00369 family)
MKARSELAGVIPFADLVGLEVTAADPSEVRGRLAWAPERCTSSGVMHGGALMTLADTLGAVCAFLNLPEGTTTSTMESKTNFFRPVRAGYAEGVSTPLHVGRSTVVVQTDIRDSDGRRVALVTQTQAVLQPKADSR